ncbi:hypothetical protein H6F76_02255 [Leptolyngbya sp. FACHB-321]|uniref:hypothetical protein n=1 Tax=Leptolyngbya sp. FACHB-321 TaxID=2692807 RepID=UPI0016883F05|nr:hypothetical protein [Leptolyngbya sp. FACHB-321]MBD2033875.1 hypothetical protein [Leptolyngbya sp. FACHB-321]
MFQFLIDKLLAPLIDEEWREEALATIDELHDELLRREYKPFIASIITFIRVLSIVVYIPAFNFSDVGLLQKFRSACKTKADNFSRYLALKRVEIRLNQLQALDAEKSWLDKEKQELEMHKAIAAARTAATSTES